MSINELKKSVTLARLCGWELVEINLYDSANMAAAWRVLNWASRQHYKEGQSWAYHLMETYYIELEPPEAQRLWLDNILELAVEAGMVE